MKRNFTWAAGLAAMMTLGLSTAANATFLPENNLWILDDPTVEANITEEQFNELLDRIAVIYTPYVEKHGARLVMKKLWTNSTVNASAQQLFGSWMINMYGGLARRPEIDLDGFALVACHELGHHMGGFPFVSRWAANEGQSDYFATQYCGRELWKDEHEQNAQARTVIPAVAKEKCDTVWTTEEDQNLCYRLALAGQKLGNLLAALNGQPETKFETPDTKQVTRTNNAHPAGQCRLDTYFAGALCGASFDISLIPGKNHSAGQGSLEAEEIASQYSCMVAGGFEEGIRPRCWYLPRM